MSLSEQVSPVDVIVVNFQERPRSTTNGAAPAVSSPTARSKKSAIPPGYNTPESWAKFFQGDSVDPETIRQLVKELSEAKRHSDVIAILEQAILAGQSQPWMYEVLALTMEVTGRPRAQIERVLLSSRDVTPADVNSLLYLAAYLARFERYPQALQCCRQAADIEPNRPEPYVEALRFAERAKDSASIAWASVGVLMYSWGEGRERQQQHAETAAAEVRKSWQQTGEVARILEFDRALADARRRDLHIRLEFSGAGDLDLLVEEPTGEICSREKPYTKGGGVFVHDGYGPQPENSYDEYVCPIAFPGEFKARVRYGWGQIVGKRARLIITRAAGTSDEQREVVPIAVASDDQIVRISVKNGRRQRVAEVIPVNHRDTDRPVVRNTILQQLAPAQVGAGQTAPFNVGAQAVGGGVGYQPVIQFFNTGISMTAMATVSGDRRYVRLSVFPQISDITDVFTFSFQGGGGTTGGTGGAGGGQP